MPSSRRGEGALSVEWGQPTTAKRSVLLRLLDPESGQERDLGRQEFSQRRGISWVKEPVDHAVAVRAQDREVGQDVEYGSLVSRETAKRLKVLILHEIGTEAAVGLFEIEAAGLAAVSASIAVTRNSVTLWSAVEALVLEKSFTSTFLRWASWSSGWTSPPSRWAFLGLHGHPPLSEAAVAHHLSGNATGTAKGP